MELTNDLAGAIGSIPKERPFSLYKARCRHFRIDKATHLPIIHDNLGLKTSHLRWAPHALSVN
jgi:hypothetical protein